MMTNDQTLISSYRTKSELQECIVLVRLELYNVGQPCGPFAIQERLKELDVMPLPSCSTISKTLKAEGLTNRRTGYYPGE